MPAETYNTICNLTYNLNDLLWGMATFILIVSFGIYFTIRIKCCNIIHIVYFFKKVFCTDKSSSAKEQKGKLSQFQALSTALAASMGTGNIIGVAAAISMGGPGAIFWMWVSAIFGTAIGFIENVLGYIYKGNGKGPMGYIAKAFNSQKAPKTYALLCVAASFGIGNMTQSNAISAAASDFGISLPISGILIAAICGAVIFGGGKKVASTAEKLVPIAAVLYLLGAIAVIVIFGKYITETLNLIVTSAMGFSQISGGICGAALKKSIAVGLRRGIFSNEAGLGSSVLIHSETDSDSPVKMGMFAVVEVVIDTLLCCTCTALVILLTNADTSGAQGLAMVTQGFSSVMGNSAGIFVAATTVIFAFCTLFGWYFYGEKCLEFVFKTGNFKVLFCYRILYIFAAFIGAITELELVWETADILNWFMLVLNLSAVVILHNDAVKEINNYTFSIKRADKNS